MFTLKESVDCIEAAESDITDIHKSRSAVAITPNGLPKQLYEAFICSIKEGDALQVYVALAIRNSKKALVYTAADEAAVLAGHDLLLEDALDFVKDMGFEMEHVDLNYSVALREVVLRGIRVIRPISAARLAARKQTTTEKTAATTEETAKAKAERERKTAEEAARAKAEEERKAAEEAARAKAEEERKAAEEAAKAKAEEERKAAEEAARAIAEEERKAAEEAARAIAEEERKAAEEVAKAKAEEERKAAEEAARVKAEEERKAAEEAARVKAEEERKAAEEAARVKAEEERKAAEEAARVKAEENRRLAELATEERQEAEKMVAEKAELARQIRENLEAEKLAAEELISALSETEKNASDTIAEEKEAAEKARAERLAAEERLMNLLEEEKQAEKKALEAQDILAAATAARMEAEQLFLQKNEEEKIAEEQAEEDRRAVRKVNEDRIAAEETADIIGQFEQRATGRCISAQKEAEAAAAEKAAAEELLAAKTAELRSALEAAEAERIMIEKILEKKKAAEQAAYQAADMPSTTSEARHDKAIEAVTEPPIRSAGKEAKSEAVQADRKKKEDQLTAEDISLHKAEIERLRQEKAKAETEWKAAAEEAARLKAETDRLMALRLKAEEERLRLQSEDVGPASAPGGAEEKKRSQVKSSGRKIASEGELNVSVSSVGAWKRAAMTASDPIDFGGPPVEAGSNPFSFPDSDDGNFFGNDSSTGGSGSAFAFAPALHSIEYSSEEEIIELHESSNLARVALEGNPSQNCKGYICAMKRGGNFFVYVAIVLTENNKVLIYNTDSQPSSADQCRGVIADAVQFLELIGFMTGKVKLGADQTAREAAIGKTSIMRRVPEN